MTFLRTLEQLGLDCSIRQAGGRIEKTANGPVFVIPAIAPKPGPLEQSWTPGPTADSRFTEAERKQITAGPAEVKK